MGETFYSALGVDRDADTETIRRAYREQVKHHHPDVSDDDDATERFKRLTEARDVLVDASSRSRYDRIGHAAYVRRHLDGTAWDVESGGRRRDDSTGSNRRESGRRRTRSSGDSRGRDSSESGGPGPASSSSGAADSSGRTYGDWSTSDAAGSADTGRSYGGGSAWTSDDWDVGSEASEAHAGSRSGPESRNRERARARADGWRTAHAADAYTPSGHDPGTVSRPASTVERVRSALGKLGPWLAFHFAFLVSAFVTVWLLVSWTPSVTSVFLGLLLLGFTVFFSILHMVSRVYA